MEYKIVEMPAFYLAGVSKRVPMQFEGVNQEIVKLAEGITEEQRKEMRSLQKYRAPRNRKCFVRCRLQILKRRRVFDSHDRGIDDKKGNKRPTRCRAGRSGHVGCFSE